MTLAPSKSLSGFAAQLREKFHAGSSPQGRVFQPSADEFNDLALALFALQFENNPPYQTFCRSRRVTFQTVSDWRDIPAIPAVGFKEFELTSLPAELRSTVFYSSGTTERRPSRHFHSAESLGVYEASLLPWFTKNLMPAATAIDFLFLTPPPRHAPHSSLVHMFETIRKTFAAPEATFAGGVEADGVWNLDTNKIIEFLRKAEAKNRAVIIQGTAFNFVHLLDFLQEKKLQFKLPAGSRVMETGGYKGRSRTMPKAELHKLITKYLGVPNAGIVCEYGMSELSSQAYDGVAGSVNAQRRFTFAPWARVQIVSPETSREVGEGETGLIRIFDLANIYSVMAIQTEDLGVRRGDGFELAGRATLAEPRGCSILSL